MPDAASAGVGAALERVGAVLVAPRRAVRQIAAGPRGRLGADVAWLMAARVVAGEAPQLARALARLGTGNAAGAVMGLLTAATAVLPDVLGILGGAIVLTLLAGRGRGERALDLAAAAWIPYLAVELAGALAFTALGREPALWRHLVDAAALGWALVVWALGMVAAREAQA